MKLFSVVMPCFNAEKYLKRSVATVLNQTLEPLEIIAIDDCSKDGTRALLEKLSLESKIPIRVLQTPKNSGPAAARNVGWKAAQGEWIAFFDSDDFWEPQKLEICAKHIESTDLISHWEKLENGKNSRVLKHIPKRANLLKSLLLDSNFLSPSAVVVRKSWLERLGGFDENPAIITAEDFDLWIRLAKEGVRFKFLTEPLGWYVLHAGNSTNAVARHKNAVLTVLNTHRPTLERWSGWERFLFRRRLADVYYSAGRAFQKSSENGKAFREYGEALKLFPFHVKTVVSIVAGPLLNRH